MTTYTWNNTAVFGTYLDNTFSGSPVQVCTRTNERFVDWWPYISNEVIANGTTAVFSVTFDVIGTQTNMIGVSTSSETVGIGFYPGQDTNSIGISSNGNYYTGGASGGAAGLGTISAGDRIYTEVNRTANTIRWSRDGSSWTSTVSISGLGTADFVIRGANQKLNDKMTLVDVTAPSTATSATFMMMGV